MVVEYGSPRPHGRVVVHALVVPWTLSSQPLLRCRELPRKGDAIATRESEVKCAGCLAAMDVRTRGNIGPFGAFPRKTPTSAKSSNACEMPDEIEDGPGFCGCCGAIEGERHRELCPDAPPRARLLWCEE